MYSGASLTNGYGMQYRENFVHHSLEVPGLHGRGGIYFGAGLTLILVAPHMELLPLDLALACLYVSQYILACHSTQTTTWVESRTVLGM